jgi:peptide deformylase
MRGLVYRDDRNGPTVLWNPEIVERRGRQVGWEGCLSLPDLYRIERPQAIAVTAFDVVGDPVRMRFHDTQARLLCHEVDHLEGRLIDVFARDVRKRKLREGP